MLRYAENLSSKDKKHWKPFEYFASDTNKLLTNIINWCEKSNNITKQQSAKHGNNVDYIWCVVDPIIKTLSAKLGKGDLIDDYWFTLSLNVVKWEEKKLLYERTSHLSAPTLLSKLENLDCLQDSCYQEMYLSDSICLDIKLKAMASRLKPDIDNFWYVVI